MAITLTCMLVADLAHVVDLVDVLVVQLADVAQAVAARQDLDEGAEVLDRRDLALVDLADLAPPRSAPRPCSLAASAPAASQCEMYTVPSSSMSILAPVASWMPLIVLAARADQQADLLRVDLASVSSRGACWLISARGWRERREHVP